MMIHRLKLSLCQRYSCLCLYVTGEILFYLLYKFYFKPNANDLTRKTIKPFRGYGRNRHLIFKRILDRMEIKCELEEKDIAHELHSFLRGWFYDPPSPTTPDSTPTVTPYHHSSGIADGANTVDDNGGDNINVNGQDEQNHEFTRNQHYFYKEELLEFFSWAFFDKKYKDLKEDWEKRELDKMFDILYSRHGFVYPMYSKLSEMTGKRIAVNQLKPICMTLEECNPLHRPLALYAFFAVIRYTGYVVLYCLGFRPYTVTIPETIREDQGKYHNGQGRWNEKVLSYWLLDEQRQQELTNDNNTSCGFDSFRSNTLIEPTLFFHGIAPAGLTFYIPMLYNTVLMNQKQRQQQLCNNPIFLFENLPITCSLVFDALTEEQTIYGVEQALSRHGFSVTSISTATSYTSNNMNGTTTSGTIEMSSISNNNNSAINRDELKKKQQVQQMTIIGHSFGSFQLTWLLNSQSMKQRIKKVILLDPVSIMLSEPDVVTNFLYCQIPSFPNKVIFNNNSDNDNDRSSSSPMSITEYFNRLKIRVFCSSELGIEYYLRRHFAWYNSELWLDDILQSSSSVSPSLSTNKIDVSIYVSEHDEILDTKKVVKEVKRFPNVNLIYWKGVSHAAVITKKELWMDVAKDFMGEKSTIHSFNRSSSGTNTGSESDVVMKCSSSFNMSRICSSSVSICSSRSGSTSGSAKDKLE